MQLAELSDYWAESPPVHEMVKAYLYQGKEGEAKKVTNPTTFDEMNAIIAGL